MAKQVKKRGRPVATSRVEPRGSGERSRALAPRDQGTRALGAASPFTFMRRFADEMDRLFEDFRLGASSLLPRPEIPREQEEADWMPSVEVSERGGKLVVRADLPGLTRDDVKVELREDALCVRGERRQEREEKRHGVYRSERTYGSFYREIPLPEGTDPEQAKATFRNGVLEVTMPAPPRPAKGRRIPIEPE